MKRLLTCVLTVTLLTVGCAYTPTRTPEPAQTSAAAPAQTQPRPVYYTGDGGSGMRLAVLEPAGRGLSSGEGWVPSLVQGSLTSDFNRYSAITVIDRQNLETILAEQAQSLSGIYSDDDYISIGKLTNARFVLTGSINRTPNAFMLDLAVTDAESGERKASYGPASVSLASLEDLSAVRTATAELLGQLGVELTETGVRELGRAAAVAEAQSQTALARGITANRQGSLVEAMHYLSESVTFDASFVEANQRLAALNTRLESGNLGENIRNEIQLRNAWSKLLDDAIDFYNKHPLFNVVYSTTAHQGNINWNRNTVEISFDFWLEANAGVLAVYNIAKALEDTGKMSEWQLESKVRLLLNSDIANYGYSQSVFNYAFQLRAELYNESGKRLAADEENCLIYWENDRGRVDFYMSAYTYSSLRRVYIGGSMLNFTVNVDDIDDSFVLRFTELGKRVRYDRPQVHANAVGSAAVIATDKPNARDYFSGVRGYTNFRSSTGGRQGELVGYSYNYEFR